MTDKRVLVMVPTYNESENIARLINQIFALEVSNLEIVVVDDDSPDGTADIVQKLGAALPRLQLIRRSPPAGRGFAGRDGYLYALKTGADYLIEMDGDFSHDPRHIPALLAAMAGCDIAIGSRLVPGGSDLDRPLLRRWLMLAANAYARGLLGLPVKDTNSGFRCFSRLALEKIKPGSLRSKGPSILHEVLFRGKRAGLKFSEIPIEFVDRKKGASKLNMSRLAAGYFWILKMRISFWS